MASFFIHAKEPDVQKPQSALFAGQHRPLQTCVNSTTQEDHLRNALDTDPCANCGHHNGQVQKSVQKRPPSKTREAIGVVLVLAMLATFLVVIWWFVPAQNPMHVG